MFKNVATKIALFAFDVTTGAPKTGDAANLTAYVSKDYGAVTALTDTSATEMDATNAKGWYLFDVTQSEANADALLFTGKSSTANVSVVGQPIFTTPNRFSSLVIDTDGLANATAVKVGPSGAATAQTAGDVPAAIAAVNAKTTNLPASPAATSDIPSAATNASTLLSSAVEGAVTVVQSLRIANSAMAGKASGLGTTAAAFRDLADTKDRIVATVDADGNRSAVTRDLS